MLGYQTIHTKSNEGGRGRRGRSRERRVAIQLSKYRREVLNSSNRIVNYLDTKHTHKRAMRGEGKGEEGGQGRRKMGESERKGGI